MLNDFSLAKQSLVYCHLLKPPVSSTNVIAFCVPVRSRSLAQVIGIVTNITTLSLHFVILCQHEGSMKLPATAEPSAEEICLLFLG